MNWDIRLGKKHVAKAGKPLWIGMVLAGASAYVVGLCSLMVLASVLVG